MSEPTKIEPALGAEEWERQRVSVAIALTASVAFGEHVEIERDDNYEGCHGHIDRVDRLPALIALANAALPDDDPRKIRRETVNVMRRAAHAISTAPLPLPSMPSAHVDALCEMADALASYLPPER